jgi:chromosomal replication initiator protein
MEPLPVTLIVHLPARLVSRLGCGLVVGLRPLQLSSRLALLQDKAQRRQLAVGPKILAWLAENLGSGRQLEGGLVQLQSLARLHDRPLNLSTVAEHFRELVQSNRLTVEHIAQRVGSYFRIEPRHLQSRRRYQNVLLPRQIGMYLARQLTDLSLGEIGDCNARCDCQIPLYSTSPNTRVKGLGAVWAMMFMVPLPVSVRSLLTYCEPM